MKNSWLSQLSYLHIPAHVCTCTSYTKISQHSAGIRRLMCLQLNTKISHSPNQNIHVFSTYQIWLAHLVRNNHKQNICITWIQQEYSKFISHRYAHKRAFSEAIKYHLTLPFGAETNTCSADYHPTIQAKLKPSFLHRTFNTRKQQASHPWTKFMVTQGNKCYACTI